MEKNIKEVFSSSYSGAVKELRHCLPKKSSLIPRMKRLCLYGSFSALICDMDHIGGWYVESHVESTVAGPRSGLLLLKDH